MGLTLSCVDPLSGSSFELQLQAFEDRFHARILAQWGGSTEPILSSLFVHMYFVEPGRLTTKWMPNLHINEHSLASDHFFRSPAVLVATERSFLAILPDLTVLARNASRDLPHALDLRAPSRVPGAMSERCSARLSYGMASSHLTGHVYSVQAKPETPQSLKMWSPTPISPVGRTQHTGNEWKEKGSREGLPRPRSLRVQCPLLEISSPRT